MAKSAKQAVLLIHGIGEQRPLDTLRGFVAAVWRTDPEVRHEHARPGVFSKPDEISGSFELRRFTTTSDRNGVRTDFYELYWAHLMEGTSFGHVLAWARRLLLRWPWRVPRRLLGAWLLLVGIVLAVAFLALQTALPDEYRVLALPPWLTGALGLATAWAAVPLVNGVVGDAARYLNPAPTNIHRRQEIRAKGVEVLNKLHESGEYGRIVVVGHSLGSVIGYDILTHAWPAHARTTNRRYPHPALDALEDALLAEPRTGGERRETALSARRLSVDDYQAMQRGLLGELQANGCTWLVSDFVTLGSPLTHAGLLLARDPEDLRSKQAERELPTCPPVLESGRFSFPADAAHRALHHAALFAPTRWSNLYFPARFVFWGDLIGGPLADVFGRGIRDQAVATRRRGGLFSHTLYWTMRTEAPPAESHIGELRRLVNLLDAGRHPPAASR